MFKLRETTSEWLSEWVQKKEKEREGEIKNVCVRVDYVCVDKFKMSPGSTIWKLKKET